MAATRTARARWEGTLLEGRGSVSTGTSDLFADAPLTWKARTESPDGMTSPEELLAAAHAACYAMAFSNVLATAGTPARSLEVEATATFAPKEGGGMHVSTMELSVQGDVPGIDQAAFEQAALEGETGCPISNALRGNVEISVAATLTSG
ncbi:MAG TPA: OsmC family peroxiredoxin [Actinomycetota bacterium]